MTGSGWLGACRDGDLPELSAVSNKAWMSKWSDDEQKMERKPLSREVWYSIEYSIGIFKRKKADVVEMMYLRSRRGKGIGVFLIL